nr:pyridoxal-phosphate dependent enzyme [Candidatus Kapabacteria bacterium]
MKYLLSEETTPVEEHNGILFKRDDLFLPYANDQELGGGKVRQMKFLMNSILSNNRSIKGLITCSSVNSPQGLIVAKEAKKNNLPCIVCIGGRNSSPEKAIQNHASIYLAHKAGAEIRTVAQIGYTSILEKRASAIADEKNYYLVQFGINLDEYPEAVIGAIANQVENIPDELDNLIVPVGSGISFAGILVGLKRFNKKVKRVIGIQIAGYDRRKTIDRILDLTDTKANYELYMDKTYPYSKKVNHFISSDLSLNVIYEAKAYKYFRNNQD